jgi:spore germination cell wall hydrolase CwlJ-like protein
LTDADPVLTKMRAVLDGVLAADQATDPTNGALFYYATSMAPPYWVDETKFCVQIGAHKFYRGTK